MAERDFDRKVARYNARRARSREQHRRRWSWGHYFFGALWGVLIGFLATYLMRHYAALFGHGLAATPLWAWAGVIVLALSLLAVVVMYVSGVLYAFAGRFGGKRWAVLIAVLVFLGVGNRIAEAVLLAG